MSSSLARPCLVVLAAGFGLFATGVAAPARAAESYDNCKGFIDSLPASIGTQGTWCLRKDLSTAMSSGAAIEIATNNVTIDCNAFKLGGLAAGNGTTAQGIYAYNRVNITVRNCNIRGFMNGVTFEGDAGGGHAVEDNRLDGNTLVGLLIVGDGSVVRGNRVRDTGGSTASPGNAYGIRTTFDVDVIDNTVDGVLPHVDNGGNGIAWGITANYNTSGRINGNGVRRLVRIGAGHSTGMFITNVGRIHIRNNDLTGDGVSGTGMWCSINLARAWGNMINGFALPIDGCRNDGNSL